MARTGRLACCGGMSSIIVTLRSRVCVRERETGRVTNMPPSVRCLTLKSRFTNSIVYRTGYGTRRRLACCGGMSSIIVTLLVEKAIQTPMGRGRST